MGDWKLPPIDFEIQATRRPKYTFTITHRCHAMEQLVNKVMHGIDLQERPDDGWTKNKKQREKVISREKKMKDSMATNAGPKALKIELSTYDSICAMVYA